MTNLKIQFKTLTPLWTGGVDRDSQRVHESGLMGSLRWWYEAIVRGVGGKVCNPTSDDPNERCQFDAKAYEKTGNVEDGLAGVCPVCRLFGCTGWRRRFRLEATGLVPQDLFFSASRGMYVPAGNWLWRMFGGEELGGRKDGRGAAVNFTFGVQALWGQAANLKFVPMGNEPEETLARLAFLLDTTTYWGAIGAKPQHGFGQIEILSGLNRATIDEGKRRILAEAQQTLADSTPGFFALDQFFSHIYQLNSVDGYFGQLRIIGSPPRGFAFQQHFIPCAFDIRYKSRSRDFRTGAGEDFGLRPRFREIWGRHVTHQLFGRSDARRDDERSAGRIHVSHPYRSNPDGPWMLKIWGHVPSNLQDEKGRRIGVNDVEVQITDFVQAMFPDTGLLRKFNREEVFRS